MSRTKSVTGDPELDARLHNLLGEFAYIEFKNGGSFSIYTNSGALDEHGNLRAGFRRSVVPGIYEFDVLLDPCQSYVVVGVNIETAGVSFGPVECGIGKTVAAAVEDAEKRFQSLPDSDALRIIAEHGIDS